MRCYLCNTRGRPLDIQKVRLDLPNIQAGREMMNWHLLNQHSNQAEPGCRKSARFGIGRIREYRESGKRSHWTELHGPVQNPSRNRSCWPILMDYMFLRDTGSGYWNLIALHSIQQKRQRTLSPNKMVGKSQGGRACVRKKHSMRRSSPE